MMDKFDLDIYYLLNESYVPPRCRKPRLRTVEKLHTVHIPIVDEINAPVVFSHDGYDTCSDARFITREFREHHGKLYVRRYENPVAHDDPERHFSWTTVADLKKQAARFKRSTLQSWAWFDGTNAGPEVTSEAEAVKALDDAYKSIILLRVDGDVQVWRETNEPMYVIHVFGLGNNQTGIGTWLSITCHYNENIDGKCYFRADQLDKAVAEALAIAERRGDTKSIPYIKGADVIRIHPGAVLRRGPKQPWRQTNIF